MQDIIDYLKKRQEELKTRRWSCKLIEKYNVDIERGVHNSINVLQFHFRKDATINTALAKLTAASSAIGRNILLQCGYDSRFAEQVHIGDFFLEGLYAREYITIYRPPNEKQLEWDQDNRPEKIKGKRPFSRTPYIIEADTKWSLIGKLPDVEVEKMIINTIYRPIPRITRLFQRNHKPVIKHWNYEDENKFKQYLDEPFIKAINKLQSTPWNIDTDILNIVKNNKDSFCSETIKVKDLENKEHEFCIFDVKRKGFNKYLKDIDLIWNDLPFKPELGDKTIEKRRYAELRRYTNKLKGKEDSELFKLQDKYDEAARNWNAKLVLLKNRSKLDSYTMTIKKANVLRDKTFYQYVDADYRGRIYYGESYLNYQGKDLERGLLKFAYPTKLDQDGLYYLYVHAASSYNQSYNIKDLPTWLTTDYKPYLESEGLKNLSVDKMTINDRALWTENNKDLILNTWKDKIIHDCEKPVVFLACCKEIYGIENCDSEVYYTSLPIPIDGSNNGWQHLAAISKDEKAGELVGLVPIEIQKDFYVQTAKALIKRMPEWFAERSNMKMKHIRKGISKRGSMTRAYSAGHLAIALNMYADCYTEGYHSEFDISMSDCNELAFNLIKAIDEVCPGPLSTMSYLQKIANHILREEGNDIIEWTTPSGFPVVYEAYIESEISTKSFIHGVGRIEHAGKEPKLIDGKKIPDPGKFAAGISPNFIHSMDASHMAIVIANWDHSFAAIHDSFSTHANNVSELIDLTKEVFIKTYNRENFYNDIKYMLLENPDDFDEEYTLGQLNIEDIHKSDYFFA